MNYSHMYRAARFIAQHFLHGSPSETKTILPTEVETLLDYRGGLEKYHRDDAWTAAVTRHFEFNLSRMVRIARDANVPVILVESVSNLKDCPPFKFEHRADLSTAERDRFEALWASAKKAEDPRQAIPFLQKAIAIDDRHAGVYFHLAKCYEMIDWTEEARTNFIRAKEEDICPLRMREPMYAVYDHIARAAGVPLVDMRTVLEPLCEKNILGNEAFADHVHPSIEGHQKIAENLLSVMESMHMVRPRDDWKETRHSIASNSPPWTKSISRGKQHLEGLRLWSSGRAAKIRSVTNP